MTREWELVDAWHAPIGRPLLLRVFWNAQAGARRGPCCPLTTLVYADCLAIVRRPMAAASPQSKSPSPPFASTFVDGDRKVDGG